MKTNHQRVKKFTIVAALVSVFFACEKETAGESAISSQDLLRNANLELISEEVDNIVETVFYEDISADAAAKSGAVLKTDEAPYLPACAVITTQETGTTTEKIIDFGDGCGFVNGAVLRGSIHLSYEKNPEAASVSISVSFENFYINDASISGERNVVRVLANENGNPQATISFTIGVVWENGVSAQRSGTKVREWIEGADTPGIWGDNVYVVSGEWTTVFSTGTIHEGKVLEPLRRELSCRFLVSGLLEIQRNQYKGVLDYGNGDCDNEAEFTYENGNTRTILLN